MTEEHEEQLEIDTDGDDVGEEVELSGGDEDIAKQFESEPEAEVEEQDDSSDEDAEAEELEDSSDEGVESDELENSFDKDVETDELEDSFDEDAEAVEQDDSPGLDEDIEVTTESVVEAILFASDESLTVNRLTKIVEISTKQVNEHIQSLNEKYRAGGRSFRIEKIAGGYQMMTLGPYNNWLRRLLRVRSDTKLSAAALETLAIIAYKQPVIRADIEVIRGVAAGDMIRSLMYKGLVKIVGRAEVLGRPMLYGTTRKFLEIFGLNTLKDLPKIEELKKP